MQERKTGLDRRREESYKAGWELCEDLADEAGLAAVEMEKSWAGSGGDTQMAEMRALRYGASLAYDCNRATARTDEGREVTTLIMYHHDPLAKYEARSALTALASYHNQIAPYFTALGGLTMPSEVTLDAMCQQFLIQEPALAKMWHNWLWPEGLSENDHGEASLFAIAASRLSRSMEAIIGPNVR